MNTNGTLFNCDINLEWLNGDKGDNRNPNIELENQVKFDDSNDVWLFSNDSNSSESHSKRTLILMSLIFFVIYLIF